MSRSPNSLLSTSYDETFDYLFKIVLIGDCGTGKTCVVQRFKTGQYEERHGNTIGVDFSMKTVNIGGKKIKVSQIQSSFVFRDSISTLTFPFEFLLSVDYSMGHS